MADIVLINPKFDISFWGVEAGLDFLGKRASVPEGAASISAASSTRSAPAPTVFCCGSMRSGASCIFISTGLRARLRRVTGD